MRDRIQRWWKKVLGCRRRACSSFRASFSPKRRGITQNSSGRYFIFADRLQRAVHSRGIVPGISMHNKRAVSPCTVAHTSDHPPFPSHEPKRDVPPPVIANLLFPRDLSLLLLLSLASRAALSSLVCRLSFEAYNEMRKRDGGIHRWPNRGDSLTKGNPICTWGDGGRRPPSQRALVFHGNSFVTWRCCFPLRFRFLLNVERLIKMGRSC